ncbi:MAG TPA: hypothetical protein PL107_03340 [Candidatus Marinimicrobia bacterium]|nr:hypothetical protein [Bacteroidales bacterium]HOV23284.1 hypothetical protein [Candidatus Neomarinimicrobiota bacterium]
MKNTKIFFLFIMSAIYLYGQDGVYYYNYWDNTQPEGERLIRIGLEEQQMRDYSSLVLYWDEIYSDKTPLDYQVFNQNLPSSLTFSSFQSAIDASSNSWNSSFKDKNTEFGLFNSTTSGILIFFTCYSSVFEAAKADYKVAAGVTTFGVSFTPKTGEVG